MLLKLVIVSLGQQGNLDFNLLCVDHCLAVVVVVLLWLLGNGKKGSCGLFVVVRGVIMDQTTLRQGSIRRVQRSEPENVCVSETLFCSEAGR